MSCGLFHSTYEEDEAIFQTLWVKCWLAALIIFLLAFPLFASEYTLNVFILLGIYIIGAHGLNLLTGFTGQISLGHAAFMGVGAYASAILMTRYHFPFLLAMVCAGFITAGVGMIFGVPSLRLKGLYLAIATLAAQFIIQYTMRNWNSMTGGSDGFITDRPSIFGYVLDDDRAFYYLVLVIVILSTIYLKNLLRTKTGRAFVAVRDRYISAEVMGVNLFKYRLLSFGISSFYVGIAGSLYAHYMRVVSDEHFTIWLSVEYLAMVIIGGLGHVLGGIFGAIFMSILPQILLAIKSPLSAVYPNLFAVFDNLQEMVFGLIIISFLIFEPDGLAARWHTIRSYWKLWPFSY